MKLRKATKAEINFHNKNFSKMAEDKQLLLDHKNLGSISNSYCKKVLAGMHNAKMAYIKEYGLTNKAGELYTTVSEEDAKELEK